MIGVVISWFLMSRFGRRTLYLAGLSCQFTVLLIIGFVSLAPTSKQRPAPSFATGALLLLFTLCYDTTIGTLAYSIVTEMPSGRLRTKSIVLARILYNCVGTFNSVVTPFMLNTAAWNWKGKAGFFWAGSCALCFCWTYFRLPEPKGRTYAELDILFERKISARKFRSTVVDAFSHGSERVQHFESEKKDVNAASSPVA